jgi:non-lysosomal glucosylceramidase
MQPPVRTWQRKFEDEGKKIAMFSMTMKDLMTVVSIPT